MPWIEPEHVRQIEHRMQQLTDRMAREQAERKLAEMEARLAAERERRGLQPVTTDTGQVIGWVTTRVDTTYDPFGGKR